MGLWPDFRNSGCKKIGSHFRFEGEEYEVDHAPIQWIVISNQEQPDLEKQYEGDNHRHCTQHTEESASIWIRDDPMLNFFP